jgi:hypothetical protein
MTCAETEVVARAAEYAFDTVRKRKNSWLPFETALRYSLGAIHGYRDITTNATESKWPKLHSAAFFIRGKNDTAITATSVISEAEQTTSLLLPYRIDQECTDRYADSDANSDLNHSKTSICQQAVVLHIIRHRVVRVMLGEKISVGNCIDQAAGCGKTPRHLNEDCRME